jgi:hypothetical protein
MLRALIFDSSVYGWIGVIPRVHATTLSPWLNAHARSGDR